MRKPPAPKLPISLEKYLGSEAIVGLGGVEHTLFNTGKTYGLKVQDGQVEIQEIEEPEPEKPDEPLALAPASRSFIETICQIPQWIRNLFGGSNA